MDVWIEVWKNMKWLFFGVILQRPYVRRPEDAKFNIFEAMNGRRDIAIYGGPESYAMLDIPNREEPNEIPPSFFYSSI